MKATVTATVVEIIARHGFERVHAEALLFCVHGLVLTQQHQIRLGHVQKHAAEMLKSREIALSGYCDDLAKRYNRSKAVRNDKEIRKRIIRIPLMPIPK